MAWQITAKNKITGEKIRFEEKFETEGDAEWNIDNNIEWDEEDNPDEWEFEIVEAENDDCDEPHDLECGFDPYVGDYTWDC